MQKHEFENLTGMTVEEPTFQVAESIYLTAGSLTKEEVCREIKEQPWMLESRTIGAIVEEAEAQIRLAAKRLVDIEKLKAALLDACWIADDNTAWRGAAELIGRATCIIYKLGKDGSCLNKEDVEYIKGNLR